MQSITTHFYREKERGRTVEHAVKYSPRKKKNETSVFCEVWRGVFFSHLWQTLISSTPQSRNCQNHFPATIFSLLIPKSTFTIHLGVRHAGQHMAVMNRRIKDNSVICHCGSSESHVHYLKLRWIWSSVEVFVQEMLHTLCNFWMNIWRLAFYVRHLAAYLIKAYIYSCEWFPAFSAMLFWLSSTFSFSCG